MDPEASVAKKSDNTLWYVLGGAAVLGGIALLMRSSKAQAAEPAPAPIAPTRAIVHRNLADDVIHADAPVYDSSTSDRGSGGGAESIVNGGIVVGRISKKRR